MCVCVKLLPGYLNFDPYFLLFKHLILIERSSRQGCAVVSMSSIGYIYQLNMVLDSSNNGINCYLL